MKQFAQKLPRILLLLAWLPLITFLLPFPTQENSESGSRGMIEFAEKGKDARKYLNETDKKSLEEGLKFWGDPKELQTWWLARWVVALLVIVAGILASVLAVANVSRWRLILAASSLLYLLVFANFSMRFLPTWENAQLWWMLASQLNSGILVVYKELFFPVLQVLVLAVLLLQFLKRKDHAIKNET